MSDDNAPCPTCNPDPLRDPIVDTLAMVLAAAYLQGAEHESARLFLAGPEGVVRTPVPGLTLTPSAVVKLWERLPEALRDYYRNHARFVRSSVQVAGQMGVPPFDSMYFPAGGAISFVAGGKA